LVNYAKVVKAIETQNLSKKYTIAVTWLLASGCWGTFHSIYGGDVKGKDCKACRFSSKEENGSQSKVIDRDGGLMKKDSLKEDQETKEEINCREHDSFEEINLDYWLNNLFVY
jgi:hypothetical protein